MIPSSQAKYIFIYDVEIETEVELPEEEGPFEIYNLDDLINFRNLQNSGERDFTGQDVYLMADIDLSTIEYWEPIGTSEIPFEGLFYGNSYTISNMQGNTTSNNSGFFGQNNGTIKDLTVTGNIIAHINSNIGGIVGKNLRHNRFL